MSSLVSSSQMDRSAAQAYRQVTAEAGRKDQLNRDPAQVERVRGIASRLIRARPRSAPMRRTGIGKSM